MNTTQEKQIISEETSNRELGYIDKNKTNNNSVKHKGQSTKADQTKSKVSSTTLIDQTQRLVEIPKNSPLKYL